MKLNLGSEEKNRILAQQIDNLVNKLFPYSLLTTPLHCAFITTSVRGRQKPGF